MTAGQVKAHQLAGLRPLGLTTGSGIYFCPLGPEDDRISRKVILTGNN